MNGERIISNEKISDEKLYSKWEIILLLKEQLIKQKMEINSIDPKLSVIFETIETMIQEEEIKSKPAINSIQRVISFLSSNLNIYNLKKENNDIILGILEKLLQVFKT